MRLNQRIIYWLTLAVFRVLSLIPLKILFFISEGITFIVFRLIGYRREVVINNLIHSFPNRSMAEIKHIAYKYYRHLSVMMVENIYLRFAPIHKIKKRLIIEDKELLDRLYAKHKNVIVMTGHFSNWEIGSVLSQNFNFKCAAVYKKLSSPAFDKIYYDIRSRLGVEPVEMNEVFRKVVQLNKQPEPSLIFMVADQSPMKNDQQLWLQFLNQPTGAYTGSEKLARRFDYAVIYMQILRIKKGLYRCNFKLITENSAQTALNAITFSFFNMLERSIQQSPRYWLWSHRRWKHKPQEGTNVLKQMPVN